MFDHASLGSGAAGKGVLQLEATFTEVKTCISTRSRTWVFRIPLHRNMNCFPMGPKHIYIRLYRKQIHISHNNLMARICKLT